MTTPVRLPMEETCLMLALLDGVMSEPDQWPSEIVAIAGALRPHLRKALYQLVLKRARRDGMGSISDAMLNRMAQDAMLGLCQQLQTEEAAIGD